jgi:uncharacterized protein (TIGR02145 family)
MKKNYLVLAATLFLLSSCNNEIDSPSPDESGSKAISFKTWADKPVKSGVVTGVNDVTEFTVAAWLDNKLPSSDGLEVVLINGVEATGNNTDGWVYSPTAFWDESTPINFYAYTPGAAKGLGSTTPLVAEAVTNATPVIAYSLPGHSTASMEDIADQEDLLVAYHQGTFQTEYVSGVPLTFRHALSRIKVQAKSESTAKFVITSLKLKNIMGTADLDIKTLPRDGAALKYATDATVDGDGYAIYWSNHIDKGELAVDFGEITINEANTDVKGVDIPDNTYVDVTDDEHALYVIPQELASSDLAGVFKGSSTSTEFFIEITYYQYGDGIANGEPVTYSVPVPAVVGAASASSIAFEMQKQYTFQFELTGLKPIMLKSVAVQDWNEATPAQELPIQLTWAGSNIYYDETAKHLTFADSNDDSKKQIQGVFFKWGSLIGISPIGDYTKNVALLYPLAGEVIFSDIEYDAIPYVDLDPGEYERTAKYLTTDAHDPENGKGDICRYLTDMGYAPKGKIWRMPTSSEFEAKADYTRKLPFTAVVTTDVAGLETISSGCSRNIDSGQPFFPASGYRNTTGELGGVGEGGGYWSSSPASATDGYFLYFNGPGVGSAGGFDDRQAGFPVRCVAE